MADVEVGDSATLEFLVTDEDTAIAVGSGDVPVLGTPKAIAWAEAATMAAIQPRLAQSEAAVGVRVDVEHCAASRIGDTVVATAVVASVDRRRVTFDVTVVNPDGATALMGTVDRVVLDRASFLS